MTKVEINGVTYRVGKTLSPGTACDFCSFGDARSCPKVDDDDKLLCVDYDNGKGFTYFKRIE